MNSFDFINLITLNPSSAITWGVAFVILCTLLINLFPGIQSYIKEKKLELALKKISTHKKRNIIISDGMGGSAFIDYLLLTDNSILVIIIKRFRGAIFCAENIDQWTILVGKKSYKFPNPLQQLEHDVAAVKNITKSTQVRGELIFYGNVQFPKGKLNSVVTEFDIRERVKQHASNKLAPATNQLVLQDWEKLLKEIDAHSSEEVFAQDYFKLQDIQQNKVTTLLLSGVLIGWIILRFYFASH